MPDPTAEAARALVEEWEQEHYDRAHDAAHGTHPSLPIPCADDLRQRITALLDRVRGEERAECALLAERFCHGRILMDARWQEQAQRAGEKIAAAIRDRQRGQRA